MPNIFISYRRDDSLPWTGRLHDHFARHFGAEHVFVDIDSIEPGDDFSDVVRTRIEECDVFVPVIGRSWMTVADASGNRRLDDRDDYVRMEVSTALSLRKRIVPVIVGGAKMPEKRDLPGDIAALATKNGFAVDDLRFAEDVRRLILMLERATSPGDSRKDETRAQANADPVVGAKTAGAHIAIDDSNREHLKQERTFGGLRRSWKVVAGIAGAMAVITLTTLVYRSNPSGEPIYVPPEPNAPWNGGGAERYFDPTKSPVTDADAMKLKRTIDERADLKRIIEASQRESGSEPMGLKPNLGVLLEPVGIAFSQALGLQTPKGAMISEVARGSLAEELGLRRGDVIVRLDGRIVQDVQDFDQRIAKAEAGKTVNIDVWRILGSTVDTFTIRVTLPTTGQAQPILRSRKQQALLRDEAARIMKQYDETARDAIEKMNQ
jgi:hypothetical protein